MRRRPPKRECQERPCHFPQPIWPLPRGRLELLRAPSRRLGPRRSLHLSPSLYFSPALSPSIKMMVEPPRTGAYLFKSAPNAPAIPVAMNAAAVKVSTASRICCNLTTARWYFMVKYATIVMAIGATHATCSFHSIPILCHSDARPLDNSSDRG